MKNGLMQLNSNAEAYVAKLLGMVNTQEPDAPTNVVEEFLNLILANGGVIPREGLVEYVLDGLENVVDPNPNKLYVVPSENAETNNLYTEYVYLNGKWEKFGKAQVILKLIDDLNTSEHLTYSSTKLEAMFNEIVEKLNENVDNTVELSETVEEHTDKIVEINNTLTEGLTATFDAFGKVDEILEEKTQQIEDNTTKINTNTTKINQNATEIAKTNTTVSALVDSILELEKQVQELTERLIVLEPTVEEDEEDEDLEVEGEVEGDDEGDDLEVEVEDEEDEDLEVEDEEDLEVEGEVEEGEGE